MNQILLFTDDFIDDDTVLLKGRRLVHLNEILGTEKGDTIKAGLFNSKRGSAKIVLINDTEAHLRVSLQSDPPCKIPVTLIIALQRPKTMKKIFQYAASAGIGEIHVTRTWRVDKSYFDSPVVTEEGILTETALGLEQSLDTIPPEVTIHPQFKPFAEDLLPSIISGKTAIAAHPYAKTVCPHAIEGHTVIAMGPEGGFIPYEIDMLEQIGFIPVTFGERILRTEFALPYLIGKIS